LYKTRKAIGYRKNKNGKEGEIKIIKIKKDKIGNWIRNPILDSVWIKDLPMLYYSILDDELI
jgi:hypothetical protein